MVEKGFNGGFLDNSSWKRQYQLRLTSLGQPNGPSEFDKLKAKLPPTPSPFSGDEMAAFERLRTRYQEAQDTWSEHELGHLRFLKWLRQSGQLDS